MIMPLDIQNKQFAKGVRGYKEDEVDQFLDMLTLDYEKVLEENRLNRIKISDLEKDLEKKKQAENTVIDTLETAKALLHDISESADKRAKLLIRNAELDAELIVREARENVEKYSEEYQEVKNRFNIFNTRFRTLLESELENFDTLGQKLLYGDKSKTSFEDSNEVIDINDLDKMI